jgi:hypothetical protein
MTGKFFFPSPRRQHFLEKFLGALSNILKCPWKPLPPTPNAQSDASSYAPGRKRFLNSSERLFHNFAPFLRYSVLGLGKYSLVEEPRKLKY